MKTLLFIARYVWCGVQLRSKKHLAYSIGSSLSLAFCLLLLFPQISKAQAILLSTSLTPYTVVTFAPTEIQMWFSEPLDATYSTARVFRGSGQRVDQNNAHVNTMDRMELDVNVPPNLPPALYIVQWRTQSAKDGRILLGSFSFTVANADGSTQKLLGALPGQDQLGSGASDGVTDPLSNTALLALIMELLIELGTFLWVGAQLWRAFVSQPTEEQGEQQQTILQMAEQRFDRLFSLPTLLVIFFANIGILVSQALILTHGQLAAALSPSLLFSLLPGSTFGTYWTIFQVVLLLAILIALYSLVAKSRFRAFDEFFSLANLLLGLALLIALTLSGQASSLNDNFLVFTVLIEWLQLFAATLWIGGIFYIAIVYLPLVIHAPIRERIGSLLLVLPRYSPLALVGIILIVITTPLDASLHTSTTQLLLTLVYGRVLIIMGILVCVLLLTSLYTLRLAHTKIAKDLHTFDTQADNDEVKSEEQGETVKSTRPSATQTFVTSEDIAGQTRRLINVLRFEPFLGVALVLCSVLLTTFSGTLAHSEAPILPQQSVQTTPTPSASAFTKTLQTTDKRYTLSFGVTPNQFGNNQFIVNVQDSNGQPDGTVHVSLFTTMLDMDMGTNDITMQLTGQGHFTASGELGMSGHWQVRIDVRAPNGSVSHATVDFQNSTSGG